MKKLVEASAEKHIESYLGETIDSMTVGDLRSLGHEDATRVIRNYLCMRGYTVLRGLSKNANGPDITATNETHAIRVEVKVPTRKPSGSWQCGPMDRVHDDYVAVVFPNREFVVIDMATYLSKMNADRSLTVTGLAKIYCHEIA